MEIIKQSGGGDAEVMLDAQKMERKGRTVLALVFNLPAKTGEKFAE